MYYKRYQISNTALYSYCNSNFFMNNVKYCKGICTISLSIKTGTMQSNQFPCGKMTVLLLVMQTSEKYIWDSIQNNNRINISLVAIWMKVSSLVNQTGEIHICDSIQDYKRINISLVAIWDPLHADTPRSLFGQIEINKLQIVYFL